MNGEMMAIDGDNIKRVMDHVKKDLSLHAFPYFRDGHDGPWRWIAEIRNQLNAEDVLFQADEVTLNRALGAVDRFVGDYVRKLEKKDEQ